MALAAVANRQVKFSAYLSLALFLVIDSVPAPEHCQHGVVSRKCRWILVVWNLALSAEVPRLFFGTLLQAHDTCPRLSWAEISRISLFSCKISSNNIRNKGRRHCSVNATHGSGDLYTWGSDRNEVLNDSCLGGRYQ